MQMGVPRARLQRRLIEAGHTVRLCVPYGASWKHSLSYARGRLHADPTMISFGLRNLIDRMLGRG